ncbi:pilus assembly protein TadG-related protein [Auraticoccus monumenti]|uniref:pilus assembly protein TadG-related protein n=1 Tax=Auraticoccus monumenti TaxID=675864 RepID=UPI000B860D38|nr:pilus assembly protein TadG-related protein [Auraticoccus monumenti]
MRTDERGQSLSIMVLVVLSSLFLLAGLVIDGGQQVVATRRAEAVAAAAARVGADAGAAALVASADRGASAADAGRAARAYLAQSPDVTGTVTLEAGTVGVRTSSTEPTVFLSLIGVGSVTGEGSATAELFAVGG